MDVYEFDISYFEKIISSFNDDRRLAFGLLCCERLYPNFVRFSLKFQWSNSSILRGIIDFAWKYLLTENNKDNIVVYKKQCDDLAPDTEKFETILVSSALDSVVSVSLLLDIIATPDNMKPVIEILNLATDTVDMFVQEFENMDSCDSNLENKIKLHPLMQAELKQQRDDLEFVNGCMNYIDLCNRFKGQRKSTIEDYTL